MTQATGSFVIGGREPVAPLSGYRQSRAIASPCPHTRPTVSLRATSCLLTARRLASMLPAFLTLTLLPVTDFSTLRRRPWLTAAGAVPDQALFVTTLRRLVSVTSQANHSEPEALHSLLVAVAPHFIQAAGRWSSNAFQIYIRKHPMLLPYFVVDALKPGPPPVVTSLLGPSS